MTPVFDLSKWENRDVLFSQTVSLAILSCERGGAVVIWFS